MFKALSVALFKPGCVKGGRDPLILKFDYTVLQRTHTALCGSFPTKKLLPNYTHLQAVRPFSFSIYSGKILNKTLAIDTKKLENLKNVRRNGKGPIKQFMEKQ